MAAPISSEPRLDGRFAIVTGAARGVGQATAIALACVGADLALFDMIDQSETVAAVQAEGRTATPYSVDVGDRNAVKVAVAEACSDRGLDVLVTAAGIYGATSTFEDLDDEEVDRVLRVNVKGTLWCVQAALPRMATGGKVVCIGSVAGKVGGVLAGPHYVASKGAIHAFVRWVAKAGAARGVYANGIAPGAVNTEMIRGRGYSPDYCPLGRLGEPEDIAQAVIYLASPASNYVTGSVLDVNGGYFMG